MKSISERVEALAHFALWCGMAMNDSEIKTKMVGTGEDETVADFLIGWGELYPSYVERMIEGRCSLQATLDFSFDAVEVELSRVEELIFLHSEHLRESVTFEGKTFKQWRKRK